MNFAVIDTETNWNDDVMSIGVVIADSEKMQVIDAKYYLLDPEYKMPGMYSNALLIKGLPNPIIASRKGIMEKLHSFLRLYNVQRILAYNASFDKGHLPELGSYIWCDIMMVAAYRQYNHHIPSYCECYKTGRMKHGYGVEAILRMLGAGNNYIETHNAYFDALDEFKIVKLLGHSLEIYDIGCLNKTNNPSVSQTGNRQTCIHDGPAKKSFSKVIKEKSTAANAQRPAPVGAKRNADPMRSENKKEPKVDCSKVFVGAKVIHKAYGVGIIVAIDYNYAELKVRFSVGEKSFFIEKENPFNAFTKGSLRFVE